MTNFIKDPIENKKWDPSKGDYFSEQALEEEKAHLEKAKKKKFLIYFLIIMHLIFFSMLFIL